MSILANANAIGSSGVDVGDIPASLRLRSSASAYLSRTFGTPTNNKKWTWSGWVKRGKLGEVFAIFTSDNGSNEDALAFLSTDTIRLYFAGQATGLITNAVFRDPTSHFHLVVSVDTTQATASDRVKIYSNGVQLGFTGTDYPSQNLDTAINKLNNVHYHGFYANNSWYLDGYLSRVCFVDGQALTPSSFGYLNTDINEWVSKSQSAVKAVVDAGGANSFMLDFDDATSLTTLGYDKSSKANHWTCNNISLTAGVTYDHMSDVPGNSYCTLSPIDKGTASYLPNNGNLNVPAMPSSWINIRSTNWMSSGKWYWEVTLHSGSGTDKGMVGIVKTAAVSTGIPDANGWAWNLGGSDGGASSGKYTNSTQYTPYGTSPANNGIIGVAFDAEAGTLEFFLNGSSQGTAFTGLTSGPYSPAFWQYTSYQFGCNFGQRPFAYTPPTGFLALCQANLPDPAILNPREHFDVVTWTGTGASNSKSITGLQFPPDMAWCKSRASAYNHRLYDTRRGAQAYLSPNQTIAEVTSDATLTAFNSDGFTVTDSLNVLSDTLVGWAWKAGGAGVTNTAGTITSTVSANVEAGFSIVTYTGTGANATVGHGLANPNATDGGAPKLVIVKTRSVSGYNWNVWHSALTVDEYLQLNTTAAKGTGATNYWNSTAPTSAVFSLGTALQINESTKTYVAYCFAEIPGFSKIGSYVGNGSTDGPFVFCGFKPRFVMTKRTDGAGDNWTLHDSARSPYNVASENLRPNSSAAEGSYPMDFTATGFKWRQGGGDGNETGASYIFIAFADVAGKFSLAR